MILSFLYQPFCRVLQLIRLPCRRDSDLAIEDVMLRHEVAVLRRQLLAAGVGEESSSPRRERDLTIGERRLPLHRLAEVRNDRSPMTMVRASSVSP